MIRALFILAFMLPAPTASSETPVFSLAAEIAQARDGEIILVPAGEYDIRDVKVRRSITLAGATDGETVFFASKPVAKGLLNPMPGVSLTVRNVTFRNAASPDQNGAGIRHDGLDLTIRDCRFINNENGVLSTGDDTGAVTITGSAFIDNGFGDGYSHGLYVVRANQLTIDESRFIGTRIGHHVKSLAQETQISNSVFDDAKGGSSYAIDASRGGAVSIIDNHIIHAATSENAAIFNYDLTRGGEATSLIISGNRIDNHRRHAILLRNPTAVTPVFENNVIKNFGRATLK